jgi:hypothetical protein
MTHSSCDVEARHPGDGEVKKSGRLIPVPSIETVKGTETRIRPVSRSFFEFARPAAPPRPRWGIQTVHQARHLFS